MIRTVIFLLILSLLMVSCHSENDNSYFYEIEKEVTETNQNQRKIYAIYKKELKKYQTTKDLKYLLSSKYAESFLYPDNKSKQISVIYELLRINDDENEFITIACNFFLALKIEETSPKLSLQFLNEAIKIDEKNDNRFFLPHLYHPKGRWYFKHNNYSLAKIYFAKALKNFKKDEVLYIASMYNNFAMCNYKLGSVDSAINHVRFAIKLLRNKKNLKEEEIFFIYIMKGNLGSYYLKKGDYVKAELYFNEQIDFQIKAKKYHFNIVRNSDELFELYEHTNQLNKEKKLANVLINILPNLTNTRNKIIACALLRRYFARRNDMENMKIFSDRLDVLNRKYNDEITKEVDNISDVLNGYIIKNINQKFDFKIRDQRRKNMLLLCLILATVVISVNIILKIRERNKKEKERLERLNLLLESSKVNLERDIQLQKGKIKNLHMNLNLKIETEKAFLENLKKIKKSKNIDAEETVKDLFFKINNLLQIDEKNNDFVNESSEESKAFMKKLSEIFPFLSEHDLKLCVYFRLNLSSKEISLLENITPGSVRVYKTKITSKIGLTKEQDLSEFLNTIK